MELLTNDKRAISTETEKGCWDWGFWSNEVLEYLKGNFKIGHSWAFRIGLKSLIKKFLYMEFGCSQPKGNVGHDE